MPWRPRTDEARRDGGGDNHVNPISVGAEPAEVRDRVRLQLGAGVDVARVAPGPFQAVLCHGVLMYLDDLAPMLSAVSAVAGPGAVLSLLVRNGLAPAMRDGLRGRWAAATAAFDRAEYVNRLELPAHAHTPADLDAVLLPLGWQRHCWYGVRVFTDHRDGPAPPADEFAELLAAELHAGSRDPYRQVAALLHVVYTRR